MSLKNYPIGESGAFTPMTAATNLKWFSATPRTDEALQDVTGSKAGTTDAAVGFINGFPVTDLDLVGVLQMDSDSSYGLSEASHVDVQIDTTGPVRQDIRVLGFGVRRLWRLDDVTGAAAGATDQSKQWVAKRPLTMVSMRAVMTAGMLADFDPGTNVNTYEDLILHIDGYGRINGLAKIQSKQATVNMQEGGRNDVIISCIYSGAVTFTAADPVTDDLDWLYASTPPSGQIILNDGTEQIDQNAILYSVEVQPQNAIGGRIPVTAQARLC